MPKPNTPKIAIVHDWIYGGGAEKVVEQLHTLYPEAPIYTSYCSDNWRKRLDNKVITGYLQHPPFRQLRKFLPLLRQWWFAHLDLSDFDIVISSSGNGEAKFAGQAKSNHNKPTHINYCHTPVHFYWRHYETYLQNPGIKPQWLARLGLKLLINPLRNRDYRAAQNVDIFVANSSHIQSDIKAFYNRDASVIHPPVDTKRFINHSKVKRSGFVTLGRQVPMKKTDLIIKACNKTNSQLTVVGVGPEHEYLKSIAGPTIKFETNASDKDLINLLSQASGFIFASFEDFGIAPVEALACGTPVIAYQAGGALDYVIPDKTGDFFTKQTTESIVEAITKFTPSKYDSWQIQKFASSFDKNHFRNKISKLINDSYKS
ncbi:glycosyltransferase [Candidatus Saccharibacteria bacterium]|nr:glycosyltransferase [Candidatus Saccharibacteria bacterium]